MTLLTPRARRLLIAAAPLAALAAPAGAHAAAEPTAAPASFGDLLTMVPADAVSDPAAFIMYTDMALLWERIGASDEASRLDSFGALAAVETFSLTPQLFDNRFAQVDESEAEVGFNFTHIERELAVIAPPRRIVIDVTSVSPETIEAAVDDNPLWADRATTVDTEHGSYIDWGDGREIDPARTSPFRPLGQAGQLAVLGDPATTVRTIDAPDAEAVLATAAGAGDPATTSAVAGPIAELLADDVVMQAMIQPGPVMFSPPLGGSAAEIEAALEQAGLVLPYISVGLVEVADGDATRTEVLLVHLDEASAAANVERVEATLTDGVDVNTQIPLAETFPEATVTADGTVVRVDVSGEGAFARAYRMLMSRALFPS